MKTRAFQDVYLISIENIFDGSVEKLILCAVSNVYVWYVIHFKRPPELLFNCVKK